MHFLKRRDLCELTGVRMEKSWISVKLCEASIGIDCSDKTMTFRLSLQSQNKPRDKFSIIFKCDQLLLLY